MLFWNSHPFLMIQQMLAIWSLVPLPLWNPSCTFRSTQFRELNLGSLAWRILNITLLACEMRAIEHSLALPFFEIGMKKLIFSSPVATAEFSKFADMLNVALLQHQSFRIWNSSAGILSPPLALFLVMFLKANLTSHSRTSDLSEWPHHCG